MAQMEKKADFRAATTSTRAGVGVTGSKGGSMTMDYAGKRTSLKDTPDEKRYSKDAPAPSTKRISLDD